MPAIAGWLLAALVGGFGSSIVEGIVKVLISLGVGYIVYQGVDTLLDSIALNIVNNLNSLDPRVAAMLGLMKVDKAINVIISAYGVRLILKGVTSGSFRKMVLK